MRTGCVKGCGRGIRMSDVAHKTITLPRLAEVSDAPGGLPFRWAIKSFLPLGLLLLLLAALARLSRAISFLFGWPRNVN